MKKHIMTAIAAAAITMSATAGAVDADKAIEYRQGVFNAMKWHFGPMVGMVKGKIDYDAADFERRAKMIAALAQMPQEGFAEGTDAGDTDAKAEIWENKEKFDQGMKMMVEKSAALAEVAKSGDMAKIKPAFGALGKTCKGCHDNFREE